MFGLMLVAFFLKAPFFYELELVFGLLRNDLAIERTLSNSAGIVISKFFAV